MLLNVLFFIGVFSSFVETNQFAGKIYKEFAKSQPNTFLVCPLSMKLVLAMLQIGAGGKTMQELAETIDLPIESQLLRNTVRQLLSQLKTNKEYVFKTANKIYVSQGFRVKEKYKKDVVDTFDSAIKSIRFGKESAQEINTWVEEQTNNKIKNMVSQTDMDQNTAAVLINAMYFHGSWIKKFNKKHTKKTKFYYTSTNQIMIDMMSITSEFNYHKSVSLGAAFLEMPYDGKDVTMTIVLPDTHKALDNLENRIADVLVPIKYNVFGMYVIVPKFKIETKAEFIPILDKLGLKSVFGSTANFSGISDSALPISRIFQKSIIELDEKGTTAAASSAGNVFAINLLKLDILGIYSSLFLQELEDLIKGL